MNKSAVAVKRGDKPEVLCRMLAESNVREEYVLQEDKDGCTLAVQSFAAAWNMAETKLLNGELVFIIIMSVCMFIILCLFLLEKIHIYILATKVHALNDRKRLPH